MSAYSPPPPTPLSPYPTLFHFKPTSSPTTPKAFYDIATAQSDLKPWCCAGQHTKKPARSSFVIELRMQAPCSYPPPPPPRFAANLGRLLDAPSSMPWTTHRGGGGSCILERFVRAPVCVVHLISRENRASGVLEIFSGGGPISQVDVHS